MDRPLKYYNRLSILAFCILALLVGLQIFWVIKAVKLREAEINHQLVEAVGAVGLEVNGLDHAAFHSNSQAFSSLSTGEIAKTVEASLAAHNIKEPTFFAIFQDTSGGLFKSNGPEFKAELLESGARTCMSCIVAFWTLPSQDSSSGNPANTDPKLLKASSKFQYYRPVEGLKTKSGETIWLSLYQPNTLSAALRSMIYLFALNIALLLILLALFRHLIRSLSRHKQMAKVKNDFFNNMSHEFKTPISSIRLAATVLRSEQNPEKRQNYYKLIEKESKSLEQQIDKLLELSLLENKEIHLEKEQFDLCSIIQEIPQKLRLLLENNSGTLHLNCPQKGILITGDRYHLLNSLCNLVENSLKHCPQKTQIWIEAEQKGETIRISVRDDGPGIKSEDQAKIFSRFYRGQENDLAKSAGFGIGLSYVRSIIERHQGTIRLNTKHQHGTEFIIQL